jgi:hypothetical protein
MSYVRGRRRVVAILAVLAVLPAALAALADARIAPSTPRARVSYRAARGGLRHSQLRVVVRHTKARHRKKPAPVPSGADPAFFNFETYDLRASLSGPAGAGYKVIALQATDAAQIPALRAAYPGVKILVYQIGLDSRPTDPNALTTCTPYPGDNASHPDWFLTDQNGARLADAGYRGNFLMDLGDTGYEQACAANGVALAKRDHFDGIDFDGLNSSLRWSLPRGLMSPKYPTMAAWQNAVSSLISSVTSSAHANGLIVVGNIGGSTATPGLWQAWSGRLDGAEEEAWTDGGLGPAQQLGDWPAKLANVAWTEAHGKLVLVHSYSKTEAGNTYALASMLLVANGHASYSTATGGASYDQPPVWYPEYSLARRLGGPLSGYRRTANGAFMRSFAKGIVLVNPTAHSLRRLSLTGVFSGSGLTRVRSVLIGPESGLILLRAG